MRGLLESFPPDLSGAQPECEDSHILRDTVQERKGSTWDPPVQAVNKALCEENLRALEEVPLRNCPPPPRSHPKSHCQRPQRQNCQVLSLNARISKCFVNKVCYFCEENLRALQAPGTFKL